MPVNADLKRAFMWGVGLGVGIFLAVLLTGFLKKI